MRPWKFPVPVAAAACALVMFATFHAGAAATVFGDADVLKGKWKMESAGPMKDTTLTLEFAAKAFTLTVSRNGKDEMVVKGDFAINEKKTPKEIDLLKAKGVVDGVERELPDRLGVYSIEGDVLTIRAADQRPTSLTDEAAKKDSNLLKLTKVK